MAVVKNMMVRAGADFSAITAQSKKASSSMHTMQTSVTRSCSTMEKAVGALKKVFTFAAVAMAARRIYQAGKEAAEAYDQQAEAEAKLARAMRNTMNASNEEIQSVLDLASAQQKLGVIGDEVQLAGAQELSTYLSLSSSLQTLIPVMNDMAAQQYGYNVTAEQTTTIATMLGKVMNGQVSALSRYGYTFDEAQEKILKFGTEEQRAAVLAQVVEQSVRGMNQALAQTPTGRMKQLSNTLGDIKERFGQAVRTLGTVFLPLLNKVADILAAVATLANKVAQAIANVFGGKAAGSEWKYTPGEIGDVGDIADDYGDVASGIDDATDSTDKLTKATQKAKKAAEEYRQQADFDTLHVLSWKEDEEDTDSDSTSPSSTTNKSGSSGNSGTSGSSPSIQRIASDDDSVETVGWLEKLLGKVKEKWDEFKEGLDLSKLKDAFANLKDALSTFASSVGKYLEPLWEKVLKPLGQWTINEAAPAVIDILAAAFGVLSAVLDKIRPALEWLWDNFLSKIASWAGELFISALHEIAEQLSNIAKVINGEMSLGEFIGQLNPIEQLLVGIGAALLTVKGIMAGIAAFKAVKHVAEVVTGLGGITKAVTGAVGPVRGLHDAFVLAFGGAATVISGVTGVIDGLVTAVVSFVSQWTGGWTAAKAVVEALGVALAAVGAVLLGAPAAVAAVVAGIVYTVSQLAIAIKDHWDEIKKKLLNAENWFKITISEPVKDWAKNAGEGVIQAADSAKSAVKQKLQNAGNWFKTSVFEPVKNGAKNAGEGVIQAADSAKSAVKQKLQNTGNWFKTSVFEPIKNGAVRSWADVDAAVSGAKDWTQRTWQGAGEWFRSSVWEPVKDWAVRSWADVDAAVSGAKDWTQRTWQGAGEWFHSSVWEPVKKWATEAWDKVKSDSDSAGTTTSVKWFEVATYLSERFQALRGTAETVWGGVQTIGSAAADAIRDAFSTAWDGITQIWQSAGEWFSGSVFGTIVDGAIGAVNDIVGFFNDMASSVAETLNGIGGWLSDLAASAGELFSGITSFNFHIPFLADGAVIPPNRKFAAVLGDQTAGMNIEAPERLLRRIVRQETAPVRTLRGSADETLSEAISDGGTNALVLSVLDEILDAVIAGHDIVLDDVNVGKSVRRIINQQGRIAGTARA